MPSAGTTIVVARTTGPATSLGRRTLLGSRAVERPTYGTAMSVVTVPLSYRTASCCLPQFANAEGRRPRNGLQLI